MAASSLLRTFASWRAPFDEAFAGSPLAPRWRVVRIDAASLRSDGAGLVAPRGAGPVVARLAGDLGVRVQLRLPREARGDLGSAAQLALEASSPVALAYAYSAVDVAGAKPEGDVVLVDAEIADREAANAAAAIAARLTGRVDAVDVEKPEAPSAAPSIDLRSGGPAMRQGVTPGAGLLVAAAAFLVIGLAGFGAAMGREQARSASNTGGSPVVRAATELAARRAAEPPVLDTLAALSSALPKSAFLDSLEINGATVKLAGRAAQADPLPGALEQHPALSGAAFSGPTRGLDSGQQAFEITLTRGRAP